MLPIMRSKNTEQVYSITAFGGINNSYSGRINELSEGVNTSSHLYPALGSADMPLETQAFDNKVLAGGYFDKLYTLQYSGTESGNVYLCSENSQTEISTFSTIDEISQNRTMAFMKDEILIIPDNVIYHTNTSKAEQGCVTQKITEESAQEKFERESKTTDDMPMPYNTWYSAYITGNSIVSMKANYRPSSSSYTYYHFGITEPFEVGEVITLKMNVKPINATQDEHFREYTKKMSDGISLKIKEMTKTSHSTPSGSITEYTEIIFDDNSVDMGGYDEVFVLDVTVEKGIPNFVDICSFENRVWGVTEDKIHASKLGDSSEWNDYSVDSYGTLPSSCFSTEVETDGKFTAITSYNGNILAFKEDCIHKVYGNEPEEYSVTKLDCPGVCSGSQDTLSIVGGILYFMGKNGVYAYSGSIPKLISQDVLPADSQAYHAGGDDRYYYIEIISGGEKNLYVYDTQHKIWHKRESTDGIKKIVTTPDGEMIIAETKLLKMNSSSPQNWSFEFSFGTKEFASKHVCGVFLRYSLDNDGNFLLHLKNKLSDYKLFYTEESSDNKSLKVRIPVSCDRDFKLCFSGKGRFVLNSLEIRYRETGIYD